MCACATVPHLGSNVMGTKENLVVKLMPDSILNRIPNILPLACLTLPTKYL